MFILIIGVATAPVNTFACSPKTEKSSDKQTRVKKDNNSTCSKNCKHKPKDQKDCPGKCGENACKCPTLTHSSVIAIFPQTDKKIFYLSVDRAELSNYKTYPLSGFYFIWSPPNIG